MGVLSYKLFFSRSSRGFPTGQKQDLFDIRSETPELHPLTDDEIDVTRLETYFQDRSQSRITFTLAPTTVSTSSQTKPYLGAKQDIPLMNTRKFDLPRIADCQ